MNQANGNGNGNENQNRSQCQNQNQNQNQGQYQNQNQANQVGRHGGAGQGDAVQARELKPARGMLALTAAVLLFLAAAAALVAAIMQLAKEPNAWSVTLMAAALAEWCILTPLLCTGLKVVNPNEAAVYVLFGRYYGTITTPGFYFINPFCVTVNPAAGSGMSSAQQLAAVGAALGIPAAGAAVAAGAAGAAGGAYGAKGASPASGKKVSLKVMTLSNDRQKINDREGNPIEIGVVVIWKVVNPTKAVFEVDNYLSYVSIQSDAAIRNVARQYPYDISEDGDETSLRGSSSKIAEELKQELQGRVHVAGVEIVETRIAHLAYAPEIAAAMLQRQQAGAVIDARQKIVEGAVSMVEMALNKLSENQVVELDEERKAAMVSNLLVVLCGNRDVSPIVNSGTIY